jgi:hypothetical protein
MASPDRRDFDDDAWDITPEEEARFFGRGRFAGIGCLVGFLIIAAIVAVLVLAAIFLLNDVKHWADSID